MELWKVHLIARSCPLNFKALSNYFKQSSIIVNPYYVILIGLDHITLDGLYVIPVRLIK